jgi:hypothetical protein
MKYTIIFLIVRLAVLACGCTTSPPSTPAATAPTTAAPPTVSAGVASTDITGVWVSNVSYGALNRMYPVSIWYTITGQEGPTFFGVKEFTKPSDGKFYSNNFTGVISSDGRVYMSDEGAGYNIGTITSQGTLEVVHIDDSHPASWIGTFVRPGSGSAVPPTADIPNITGAWTGRNVSYAHPGQFTSDVPMRLTVIRQEGPVFTGVKEYTKVSDGTMYTKNFTGVITPSGGIYLAYDSQGYEIGKLTPDGIIELVHLVDGSQTYPRVFTGSFGRSPEFAPGPAAGTVRDVTGVWATKNASIYVLGDGYFDTLAVRYTITNQKGDLFEGVKEVVKPSDGTIFAKNFTGVVTPAGEIYFSDEAKGYNIGRFTGEMTMEVVHLADGTGSYPKTWIGVLTKE